MNTFRQHIPSSVDVGRPPPEIPFETTEDLLGLEVVRRYSDRAKFSHFAINDNLLIAVSDGGGYWWVAGYLGDPSAVDIPQWDGAPDGA